MKYLVLTSQCRCWSIFLSCLLLMGCTITKADNATPTPPPQLGQLPRLACIASTSAVWEYPGLPPRDSDPAYLGKVLGDVSPGQIEIQKYAWSEARGFAFVYIKQGEVEGWVTIFTIDLTVDPNSC